MNQLDSLAVVKAQVHLDAVVEDIGVGHLDLSLVRESDVLLADRAALDGIRGKTEDQSRHATTCQEIPQVADGRVVEALAQSQEQSFGCGRITLRGVSSSSI